MAGHLGDAQITTQNLEVISTDEDRGLLLIKGSVPGAKGGFVLVSDAIKHRLLDGVPFPAAVRGDSSGDGMEPEVELDAPAVNQDSPEAVVSDEVEKEEKKD